MTLQQLQQIVVIAEAGSMNEASRRLFVSQSNLSNVVKLLEQELGITIFARSNHGITLTPEGTEFMGYARQVLQQFDLLQSRYSGKERKKVFSVSAQHYSFAVRAFVETVRRVGMDEYELSIHETRTSQVIEDVRDMRSELGILFLSDFNEKVLGKIFRENSLVFTELFTCGTYVYLSREHPLASRPVIRLEELSDYPCLAFEQGDRDSFYLAEEVKSTYDYKKLIRADDRATMLNLMVGLDAYTLCSGIISAELNGPGYRAIPLEESEPMRVGYIRHKDAQLSEIGRIYLEEIGRFGGDRPEENTLQ